MGTALFRALFALGWFWKERRRGAEIPRPAAAFLDAEAPAAICGGRFGAQLHNSPKVHRLIFSCRRDGVRGAFFMGRAFTPSVLLPTFAGQQDSSPKEAPTIRNFINQESICSPLKPTQNNTSSFFGDPEGRLK